VALLTFRRATGDLGFNIARHVAKTGCQFFEEFALLRIGRELGEILQRVMVRSVFTL
jgi:hypothetical protein